MLTLYDNVTDLPKIGPYFNNKFKKLGIFTIEDLFFHVPSRYMDYSQVKKISTLRVGEVVTIHASIKSLINTFTKRGVRMQIGSVEDQSGKITVTWFNQPFLLKMLYPGRLVSLSGKVGFFNRNICLNSPDYEILDNEDGETFHTGRLVPVYRETEGISSKWLRTKIHAAFQLIEITDPLPEKVRIENKLLNLKESVEKVHFPKDIKEAEVGRERLAFDELLKLQLASQLRKNKWKEQKVSHKLRVDDLIVKEFLKSLPFELTKSQKQSIAEILKDFRSNTPMNRLLEGDVGSGKTAVAAAAMFAVFTNGYQAIFMAPTQILAQQHYETLVNLYSKFNIRISLLTASSKVHALGSTDIYIGTHSLIHSKINFKKVALVVIDEQHRFGVEQRQHLAKKTGTPHVLTMTATPIPRTVALTTYGDLDLSVLNEMPKGRQKVTTWVVPEKKREGAYNWISQQVISQKSQVFIVCPLIEDSEAETMTDIKSVTSEFVKLKKIFPKQKLSLLHGRLKSNEKDSVLKDFKEGKTNILVTTPVVEVGIDIPNATIMVIEAAERFGLAGLHQLRGRVGRGSKQSYCLLFSNFHSGNAYSRLKAMEKTHSGFELAELDLKLRGPGEIFGTAQSGFPELKIASWNNYELIKKAKDVAHDVINNPENYPLLTERFTRYSQTV